MKISPPQMRWADFFIYVKIYTKKYHNIQFHKIPLTIYCAKIIIL